MKPIGLLLAVLLATPALRADVLVVDAAGGGDFTSLAAAVAAAHSGDTLLVHDGEYVEPSPVVIDGKGLTVMGGWTTSVIDLHVTIRPGLVVRNMQAGQNVFLQNLFVVGDPGTATAAATRALVVQDNVSHVRVQSCQLRGGNGNHNNNPDGAAAVDIANSASTALVGCYVWGGGGLFSPDLGTKTGDGGPGVVTVGGALLVSETVVQGGIGGSDAIGGWPDGGTGGAGLVHADGGAVLLVDGHVNGGGGGVAYSGGDGGQGLEMGAPGVALLLADSGANGGNGGLSNVGPSGMDGVDIVDPAGLVKKFGGHAHPFDVTSPVREGQTGTLFLGGKSTDMALVFASTALHQIPFVGYDGVLMLKPDMLIGPFPIGPPGNMHVPFLVPLLPAGVESLLVHVQPAYVGGGKVSLGTGRVLTLLDAAF